MLTDFHFSWHKMTKASKSPTLEPTSPETKKKAVQAEPKKDLAMIPLPNPPTKASPQTPKNQIQVVMLESP